MGSSKVTLFLISGKIASGKSTLARSLASQHGAILINQDQWLSSLYPGEIQSLEDYSKCFNRLTEILGPLLIDILSNGTSVVLDFPANTLKVRAWMRGLFEAAGCGHELHFLDTPDDICLERLKVRNESGEHQYIVSEEEFQLFSSHFVPPSSEEGFNIVTS